jgi:putative transport protein
MWVGSLKVRGISLGAAGVLIVALVFGHYSGVFYHEAKVVPKELVPKEVTDLGLLLFLYAVGLAAGPRFFDLFRRRGAQFLLVGLASTGAGALTCYLVTRYLGLQGPLGAGLYTGALTSTPALAAAMDVFRSKALPEAELKRLADIVAVGYGLAYPASIIGVTVFIQLLPAILRMSPDKAALLAKKESAAIEPGLERRRFRVSGDQFIGKSLAEIAAMGLSEAKISRVKRGDSVLVGLPDTRLERDDLVLVVGFPDELDKLNGLGHIVDESLKDTSGNVQWEMVVVSRERVAGKTLRDLRVWEDFNVVITRADREGSEFSPTGSFVLEIGDRLRVVGERADIEAFTQSVGEEERRLDETSLLPFGFGIVLGVAVGLVPIVLPGGIQTKIGMGAGTFIVGLVLGRLGRLGPLNFRVPNAAKHLCRELGLVMFLAGAGAGAGKEFMHMLHQYGPQLLVAGALITLASAGVGFFLLHKVLRWNYLSSAGALSACMTNPPAFNSSCRLWPSSDAAALAFASVYPVAQLGKIMWAQVLALVLGVH